MKRKWDDGAGRVQDDRITIEGCVMDEVQVAGREPNFMERAGIGEDYILTDASLAADSSAVASDADQSARANASEPGGADESAADADAGATAAGPGTSFELEGLDDEQLQQYVGQRVRIAGSLENRSQAGLFEGDDPAQAAEDLLEIDIETITAIPGGNCAG